LRQHEDKIPIYRSRRLKEALQRLVQLHDATQRPEQAVEWRKKLAELDKAEITKKPYSPQP
jgi:hypothetical protein